MERWGKSPPVSRVTGTSCKLYPKQHRPGGYGLLGQSPNRWHRDGQQCPPKIDGCRPQNPAYRRTAGAPFSGRFFLLFRRKNRCFFELLRQRPGKNHLFAPLDCRRGKSFPPGGGFFAFFSEKAFPFLGIWPLLSLFCGQFARSFVNRFINRSPENR